MAAQPTRRGMRRLGLVVAGAAAVALVIYLAAVVVLRALLDPASLADRLEPHLSAALNRTRITSYNVCYTKLLRACVSTMARGSTSRSVSSETSISASAPGSMTTTSAPSRTR